MNYLKISLKLFGWIFIFLAFISLYLFFLFRITYKNENKEKIYYVSFGLENRLYISWIQFFAQAPLWTRQNWKIHNLSCEEATIWLYIWWLKKIKFDKFSFDKFLKRFVKWEIHKFWYQPTLSWKLMVKVINEYFTGVKANLVENLNETKISWILWEGSPIIIGISAKYLNNPYYHWKRYHTLLIVWETSKFYIIKDVWTKRGNDWYYPKDLILYAIRQIWAWWVIIKKKENCSNINIIANKQNNLIYPTVLLKNFYDDLIYSKFNWKFIDLPKDIKWWIISHHLLVAPLFDNYFRLLKQVRPNINLFIIWWTNHFDFSDQIWTTNLDFWTPYWILKTSGLVKDLVKNWILRYNNQLFKREHSIFTLAPFIKKYYPDAKILPFIVNNEVSKDKLEKLKNGLVPILKNNDDVFYLQSTDFSHYIPDDFREFYDLYSQNILNDWDTGRVFNMWIDGRKLMFLTMKLLGSLGYRKNYTLFNISSNQYLWIKNIQNTSYFFSYIWKWQNKQKSEQISLLFWGDMILNFLSSFTGECSLWTILCFQNFRTGDQNESPEDYFFKWFDLLVFNMEWNFWTWIYEKDIKWWPIFFRYDKKYLNYFKNKLKAEVLFFSNNHQKDFGLSWINLTKKLVKQYGLKYVWNSIWFDPQQNVFIKQVWNKKVVIINLNDVVTPLQDYDLKELEKFVKRNKSNPDTIVIIFIHRGREYFLNPTERQIELWHKFIDWGADLVVGSHPHVIQPLEIYKWKRIYYSLGNITYDNDRQKKVIPDIDYGVFVWVNFNSSWVNFYEMPYKIIHKRPVMLWWDVWKKILNKYLYRKF